MRDCVEEASADKAGCFDRLMREAGQCVEEHDGFRFYECFMDAPFTKARLSGDGSGTTKLDRGAKITLLVEAGGLVAKAQGVRRRPKSNDNKRPWIPPP